ncbi:YkvA family protein [Sphingomonas sp. CJ99]
MHGPSLAHRIRVEAHAVWLAARDPRTPLAARLLGLFIAAYALSPIDLIPDFLPFIGLLDEAILIPAGIWLMARMIPPALMAEHRAAAELAARRPVSWGGALVVLALWALIAWLAWAWIATGFD